MWLQNILGRVIGGRTPSLERLTVEKRPSAFSGKASRSSPRPPDLQRGGSLHLGPPQRRPTGPNWDYPGDGS